MLSLDLLRRINAHFSLSAEAARKLTYLAFEGGDDDHVIERAIDDLDRALDEEEAAVRFKCDALAHIASIAAGYVGPAEAVALIFDDATSVSPENLDELLGIDELDPNWQRR